MDMSKNILHHANSSCATDSVYNSVENNKHTKIDSCSCCSHNHKEIESFSLKTLTPLLVSAFLLILGLLLSYTSLGKNVPYPIFPILYVLAYAPVAYPVLKQAIDAALINKDFFNEFSLMSIATIGAFIIGEYPEAVAVMLLYSIGEFFQSMAVNKATKNIESLVNVQVNEARVLTKNGVVIKPVEAVSVGDVLQIRVGDRVPVDGVLLSENASFNTVALTGESIPQVLFVGEKVSSGIINLNAVIEIRAAKTYQDSTLSKILELVQEAIERKAKTELLVRKFARWYTPLVFGLALLVAFLPALFVEDYQVKVWLYRALIFLVISCPCAIVISVPLSYFGGIGASSKQGILFKGANFLDLMAQVNTVVLDKTGTITEGIFEVQQVISVEGDKEELLNLTAAVESFSAHPIAKAIASYFTPDQSLINEIENVEEIMGQGIRCTIAGELVLVGNDQLLQSHNIAIVHDSVNDNRIGTRVLVSKGNCYLGTILIADKIKNHTKEAIASLYKKGVKNIIMLSGDNQEITKQVGHTIGVNDAFGGLLPQDKVSYIEKLKEEESNIICFVGDGINDTPALAISDVGIAMGAMGADAAIEVADVVIQTDQLFKVSVAMTIARATRSIVFQNIALAFGIKTLVMFLGATGVATMWGAVVADVGVTILAVLNAMRLLYKKF